MKQTQATQSKELMALVVAVAMEAVGLIVVLVNIK